MDNNFRRRVSRPVASRTLGLLVCVLSALVLCLPASALELDDNDLLLLDIHLDRERVATAITAYQHRDTTLLSLTETAAALEFPISVEAATGQASGWFIRPERRFELDLPAQRLQVDGRVLAVSEQDAVVHGNDIFVSLAALSRWLPFDGELDRNALRLALKPRELLPMQERAQRRRSAANEIRLGPAELPEIDNRYRVLGLPAADLGLGYSVRRRDEDDSTEYGLSYSSLISADLAWMDARLYLSGDHNDSLRNARFSLVRDQLDLPLGLRYVEIGDIVPALVPGLNVSGNVERGLLLQGGGSMLGRDDLIDSDLINISGDALAGWDVELFQNGMRVGLQSVGADGRYNFRHIEPLGGENEFELVFYGPAGERRTEKLMRHGGFTPDQPGSVRYQLSVSQKNRPLHDGDALYRPQLSDEGTTRVAAGLEVRLLPRLAVRGGWTSQMIDGERRNYSSAGMRAGLGPLTLGLDATRNPWGDTRWDASLQVPAELRLLGFDARFTHSQYARSAFSDEEFYGEESSDPDSAHDRIGETGLDRGLRYRSRSGLILSRPFGNTATRFAVFHNRQPGYNSTELSAGFTHRLGRSSFGNTLSYFRYGKDREGERQEDRSTGTLFFSTHAYPLGLRGGVNYTLSPDARVDQYFIDSTLSIAKDLSAAFTLTHNPRSKDRSSFTRYAAGFNWQLPQLTLSPRLTYDSDGTYSGFVYASFALAPRPDGSGVILSGRSLATTGAVAARAFLDHDGDGKFSAGDEVLPNVVVRAPQAYAHATTDSQGIALLAPLPSQRATDVKVDEKSLPGAGLVSTYPGNSVRPRPTAVPLIEFPVVPTGSIEGTVRQQRHGSRSPLAGAVVELRAANGEVLSFKHSGQDGYYVFDQVPYGDYSVSIGGSHAERMLGAPRAVLAGKGGAVTGIDFVIDIPPAAVLGRLATAVSSMVAAVSPPPSPPAPPAASAPPPAAPVLNPTMAASASPPAPALHPPAQAAAVPPAATPQRPSLPAPRAAALPAAASAPVLALQPGSDGKVVQLGAFTEAARAQQLLDELARSRHVDIERTAIVAAERGAQGRLYRALLSPANGSAATLCARLRSAGLSCITALP